MTKFQSHENEAKAGVFMTGVIFLHLQEVNQLFLDMIVKFDLLIRTRITTSVSDSPCGVFATQGLISSSNGENYIIPLLFFIFRTSY